MSCLNATENNAPEQKRTITRARSQKLSEPPPNQEVPKWPATPMLVSLPPPQLAARWPGY
jgi:hypothetical protein